MSKENLIILVDMDGVVADFNKGWRKIWNELNPDRQIHHEPSTFYIEEDETYNVTAHEATSIFQSKDFYINLDPIPGAIEAVKLMRNSGIDVVFCSSPSGIFSFSDKVEWIDFHFGSDWVKNVILTKDKTMVMADMLIDDKPEIFGRFDPEWEHIVYDQPYNQHVNGKRRITWNNWPSIFLTSE